MTIHPLTAGLALATSLAAFPAFGQADATTLDTVVVTAARAPQAINQALASVTLLERADIERAQAPDLIDLLARQPGVDVSRTGGPGAVSTFFLRGSNSNQTLVLIDGVRVNSAQQGLYDFSQLPLDRIERIEIVRGPRAALWGSDAIGGVIQIFTRDPGEVSLHARVGSAGRAEAAAQWGVTGSRGSIGIGGSLQDIRGDNASTPNNFSFNPDDDGLRNRVVSFGARTTLGTQTLGLQVISTRPDVEFDQGLTRNSTHSGGATLNGPLSGGWTHALSLGHAAEDLLTLSSFGSRFRSQRSSVDWLHDLSLTPGQNLLFGLNHMDEAAVSRNARGAVVYDVDRRNTGAFAAWRGEWSTQQWDLALRRDDNSQFGGTSSAQAAWGMNLGGGWRTRASWGQGFRAPSTNELYSPGFSGFFAGNPALNPERSHGLETGLLWDGASSGFGLSAYRSRVRDLIAFTGPLSRATNINLARLDGLELDGRWAWGRADFRGHVGWQRAENARSGAALLRRATRKASLSMDVPASEWLRFGLDLTAASRRQDFDGPLAGYARVDLRAEASLNKHASLRVRLENLLNRDYTLASGFATPGRSLLLELSLYPKR